MPVLNGEAYLKDSIESVLGQTFGDFELIIVDDGSNLATKEVLANYDRIDKRIKLYTNPQNMGICFSRNFAHGAASGEYIAVMDADDICLPDRFEKQLTYLETHPDISLLGGQIITICDTAQSGTKSNYPLTPGGVRWSLLSGCQIAHPTVMMRRQLFSVEGFRYRDFKVAHDYDLWARLARGHNIANLTDVLVKYRVHQSSITHTKWQLQKDEAMSIVKDYIKNLSGIDLPEEIIKGLMITREIRSVDDALILSKFLLRLEKLTKTWAIGKEDRGDISHQTAYKLGSICRHFKYNPRLFSAMLAAGLLEIKARRFQRE